MMASADDSTMAANLARASSPCFRSGDVDCSFRPIRGLSHQGSTRARLALPSSANRHCYAGFDIPFPRECGRPWSAAIARWSVHDPRDGACRATQIPSAVHSVCPVNARHEGESSTTTRRGRSSKRFELRLRSTPGNGLTFLHRGSELQDFGNILDAQQNSSGLAARAAQSAGVEQHGAPADPFKLVGDLEVVEETVAGAVCLPAIAATRGIFHWWLPSS